MANERLCAYYEAQRPSEACMVRLCNLEQKPRPKPMILRLALPVAAACLLILVLVAQIRPTPEGVTAPIATSTPTARETLIPEPTPSAADTPTQSPQIPVATSAPIREGPAIPPESEGGGSDMSTPKPEPSPSSDWWWLGGGGSGSSEPPSSDPGKEDLPTPQMPEEVTDITAVYENGDLIFTDLNTGETVIIDMEDEPLEPGDSGAAGIHIFGRDLIVALVVGETAADVAVSLYELPNLEAEP